MMTDWNESKKFWMETRRTILFSLIGGIIALIIIKPFDNKSAYQGELDKEKLKLKTQVVDDFLISGYLYTSVLYDVCKTKNKDSIELNIISNDKYDSFRSQQNKLKVYFSGDTIILNKLKAISSKTKKIKQYFYKPNDSIIWESIRQEIKLLNIKTAKEALTSIDVLEK